MNGLILAAGLGTRFRPHTNQLPKPAIPFLDIPLLHYSFFLAKDFSPQEIYVNTHHLPEKIHSVVAQLPGGQCPIRFSHEENILGSAGGIGKLRTELGKESSFFILNADTVLIPDSPNMIQNTLHYHEEQNSNITLLVMEHPEAGKKYGAVWADTENTITGFGKTPPESPKALKPYHFVGLQIIHRDILEFIPEGASETFIDVLPKAFAKGLKGKVFVASPKFLDCGNLSEYLSNTKFALENFEKEPYFENVQSHFQKNYQIKNQIYISESARLDSSFACEGFTVIGENSLVESGVRLTNSVIGSHTQVAKNSVLENQLIL